MATTATTKLKVTALSATLANSGDKDRKYELRATFRKDTGGNLCIESGEASNNGNAVAWFNGNGNDNFNITFQRCSASEQAEVLTAVSDFTERGKAQFDSMIPSVG